MTSNIQNNLREVFDIPLETYLSPRNRQSAYQLWKTSVGTYINNYSLEIFDKKFEEFFKKYAKKYFDDLKDQMIDFIEIEFMKLKKELIEEMKKK